MEKKYLVGLFMVLLMASCTTSQAPAVNQPIQNVPEVETKEPTSAEISIVAGGRQDPSETSIAVGGVVTWNNLDAKFWKIYSKDKEIETVTIKAGEAYDHKFDKPGVYEVLTVGLNYGTTITVVE